MSIARAAAARAPSPPTARDDRVRHDVGRIGEAIEEIAALEVRPERLDDVAVGRACRTRRRLRTRSRLLVVVEAEHRAPRRVRAARLDVLARGRRGRLQVQDRNAVDDGKDAALAAEDAVAESRRRCGGGTARSTSSSRPPQYGTAEDVERLDAHASRTRSPVRRAARARESAVRARAAARRNCSTPSQRRASSSSIQRERVVARPSACGGSAARRACAATQSRTSTTNVGGLAPSPNASGSMPQKLESGGAPPLACAASTTSRITPVRHRHVVERRRGGAERLDGRVACARARRCDRGASRGRLRRR